MSAFATYLTGFIILTIGLAMAAYLLNIEPKWIAAGVIAMIGIGVLSATSRTKGRDIPRRDPPPPPPRNPNSF